MRKLICGALIGLIAGIAFAQSVPKDGKIYALGYGGKTDVALNAVLTAVGSDRRTIVISGGEWTISDDVTVPTNVTLEVTGDSYFNIANGEVLTINGTLDAEPTVLFTGSGTAAGSATFLWRASVWGDTNQYNIGSGIISIGNSLNDILGNGNNASSQNATNFNLIQAVTGQFNQVVGGTGTFETVNVTGSLNANGGFINPSNDMTVSFNGYPIVALTTNMATSYAFGGGTAYTNNDIALTIDGNWATSSPTNRLNDSDGSWVDFDLGEAYTGWAVLKLHARMVTASGNLGIFYSRNAGSATAHGVFKPDTTLGAPSQLHLPGGFTTNGFVETITIPFTGRYIGYGGGCGATGDDVYYSIYEFTVYGTSNNYRNVTGGF